MVECPFFLETLTQINNNTFPFQQHLKTTCDLLPPLVHTCFPLFEQLIQQQMVRLQDSISEHLCHHTLSSMHFNETSKAHHVQILSFSSPRAGVWFTVQPVFLAFELSSPIFSIVL
jgi:hypothetical protein